MTMAKLARIVAKCRESLGPLMVSPPMAEAGWHSTIAAIRGLQEIVKWKFENSYYAEIALDDIIAAWPEDLL